MISGSISASSNMLALKEKVHKNVQKRLNGRALAIRGELRAGLGATGAAAAGRIYGDTLASSQSFYCVFPTYNDYSSQVGLARNYYVEGVSRWRRIIREDKGVKEAYTSGHFDERLLPPRQLEAGKLQAICASASKVVWWWETGHGNVLFGAKSGIGYVDSLREKYRASMPSKFGNIVR